MVSSNPNKEKTLSSDSIDKLPTPQDAQATPQESRATGLPTPLDGGWGWAVVFGSFLVHIIADGVAYSFGIFCEVFIHYFDAGRAEVGWVGSLMIGITWMSGPIASALVNKFGCRKVTIMGSILAAFSFILSIFSPNIYFMYFSFGVLGGLGLGLIYLPAIVSVTYYFEKRRAFATGLAVCGSGVGTFIFAPFTNYLVDVYTWKGASLILAGILLNCMICGALFRPLEPTVRSPNEKLERIVEGVGEGVGETKLANGDEQPLIDVMDSNGTVRGRAKSPIAAIKAEAEYAVCSSASAPHIDQAGIVEDYQIRRHASDHAITRMSLTPSKSKDHNGLMYRKDIFYHGTGASLHNIPMYSSNRLAYSTSVCSIPTQVKEDEDSKCSCSPALKDTFRQMTDFSLLRDPIFAMFVISNFLTSIGFCVPYLYLPDRAMLLGISSDNAAFLISVIGIANTIGRIVFGWLSDRPWVNRLMLYNTALTLCGICTFLSVFCTTFGWLVAYAASFGGFLGVYVSLTSVVLVDLLGLECLTSSFGITLLFQGIAGVIGTPIAGWLFDATGNYNASFYFMGVIMALSGIMLYFIPCVRRRQERKHPELNSQQQRDMGRKSSVDDGII